MLTNNEEGSNFIQNLPPEVLTLIFGNLTIFELAEVQKTCKAWYAIAQKTPTLWRMSEPFFKNYFQFSKERNTQFVQGVQTLSKLSAGKLDEIFLRLRRENTDNAEIASFLESIPSLNPSSLRIIILTDSDKYLSIIRQCKSLRELKLQTCDKTPFKNNVFKDCPIQEAKLEKLTLDHNSFREWRSDESCLSVSSSIKTLILEDGKGFDLAQALDFLYHCRQSIENFKIRWIDNRILRREITGLYREIIFPNLVKASFSLWYEVSRTDNELIPFHCFKCPQIQELSLSSKYFLRLFDSVESVKKVKLYWRVDDLAEMFRTFPNIENFEARLHSEEMLRSLVDLVPKQLKHLKLVFFCQSRYDNAFNAKKGRRPSSHQLLDLVKKRSTSTHLKDVFSLCQEGAIEFCHITMKYIGPTECGLGDDASVSMCKYNFVEIITELSKMEALDTSSDTNGIVSSD